MLSENQYMALLSDFHRRIKLRERRPGIYQVFLPLYHDDGDMMDIYLQEAPSGKIRVSDFGSTMMRLSYSYDIDTDAKMKILNAILKETRVSENNGTLSIDTSPEFLYPTILQLGQCEGRVMNMRLYRHSQIRSLFYENVKNYVLSGLSHFNPKEKIYPIDGHEEYEVDYGLALEGKKPIYLFAVKENNAALRAALSCSQFQLKKLNFTSIVVHENYEDLGRKERKMVIAAADKIFPDYAAFETGSEEYLNRLLA